MVLLLYVAYLHSKTIPHQSSALTATVSSGAASRPAAGAGSGTPSNAAHASSTSAFVSVTLGFSRRYCWEKYAMTVFWSTLSAAVGVYGRRMSGRMPWLVVVFNMPRHAYVMAKKRLSGSVLGGAPRSRICWLSVAPTSFTASWYASISVGSACVRFSHGSLRHVKEIRTPFSASTSAYPVRPNLRVSSQR